jgi:DNA-binding NarL/FixJ family response regulator
MSKDQNKMHNKLRWVADLDEVPADVPFNGDKVWSAIKASFSPAIPLAIQAQTGKTFPMPHVIKVGIADDHTLFRKALAAYISQQPGITVTIQATSAQELCNQLKTTPVDLVIMDLFLPESNVIDTLQFIRTNFAEIKIITLSTCTDLDLISTLLDVGIHAYISKSDEPENLLHAIQAVHENKIYRNKFFTEALYWNKQHTVTSDTSKRKIVLDERERKIIQLLWEEKSNKEIADAIFLSVRSVEKIRQEMKEKIGVKTVAGIFKYALKYKLIDLIKQRLLV